jgi:hypothetical protein
MLDFPFTGPSGPVDRRRTRPGDDASRISCRICGARVALDPRKIEHGRDYATIPCTACSALVPIRRTDALRAVQEQVRGHLADAQARRRLLRRWKRAR